MLGRKCVECTATVGAGRTQMRFGMDEWPDVQASLLCAGVASYFVEAGVPLKKVA